MKNIFKFIATCICGALFLASCSDFLQENPTTSLSETSVYTTEDALVTQLNGCYSSLHSSALWKGEMNEFFHISSALMVWKGQRLTNEWLDCLYLTKYSTTSSGNGKVWTNLWPGINRCNRLLDNLPASPVNDAFKKQIEGEVKFIRAILYYTIVRLWGDAPLILHSPRSIDEVDNPRVAWYKLYMQVLEDLTFAEQNMRSDNNAILAEQSSRPCSWAATAMKSSVYLTIGTLLAHPDDNFWDSSKDAALIAAGKDPRTPDFSPIGINSAADALQLALDTAEDVIENGPYDLLDKYADLFRWTDTPDWFHKEMIFVLPSTDKVGGNYNAVRMLPEYPEGTINTITKNSNWGRVRPSRFGLEYYLMYSGGEKGEVDTANEFIYAKTDDPRYKATFFVSQFLNQNTEKKISTYPTSSYVNSTSPTYELPFCKKYLDPTYDVTNGRADFYFMRLAEVYLIAAEAAAWLANDPTDAKAAKAIARVNDIRLRARGGFHGNPQTSTVPVDYKAADFTTIDELRDAIFWERFIELCFEGHEWFDTHRYGATWLSEKIAKPANDFYIGHSEMDAYTDYTFLNAITNNVKIYEQDPVALRKSLLNAFPETELLRNTAIKSPEDLNDFFWQ